MKSFLLALAFLTLSRALFAATPPGEFGGIKWGASMADVRTTMAAKGAELSKKFGSATRFVYSGGTFADEPVQYWNLVFENDKFCRGDVKLEGAGPVAERFRKWKDLLSEKYGAAADHEVGVRPKGHFVLGLGFVNSDAKKPKLAASWKVESPLDHQSISIHCWVEKKLVRVQYSNESLKKLEEDPTAAADDL